MPFLNSCQFMGNIGRSAELKLSKDGTISWAEFSVAVSVGSIKEKKTMWVKCRVFGRGAERAIEKCQRGDAVYVSGRLDVNAYIKRTDNQAAADVSLNVSEWQHLGSRGESSDRGELPTEVPELKIPTYDRNALPEFGDDLSNIPF
jgi:single-stranded DNA-binding protein